MKLTKKNLQITSFWYQGKIYFGIEIPYFTIDKKKVLKVRDTIISNQNKLQKFINSVQNDSDGTGYSKETILEELAVKNEHRVWKP